MSHDGRANGHIPDRTKRRSIHNGTASSIANNAEASRGAPGQLSIVPDINKAATISDIHGVLSLLTAEEESVTKRLQTQLRAQQDLQRELGRLDLLRAHLGTQVASTRSISYGMLSSAATSAKRITKEVASLDLEQNRIKDTLTVVEQVAELKACVLGVAGSMGAAQDWETAAKYLQRARKVPEDIVKGAFAEGIVPTSEVPDPPSLTLHNAAESLCNLFLREFEKAVNDGDGARIARFFKLFPLIGRSDVGLDVYGRYVCQGVASTARANLNAVGQSKEGFFYANALTRLFEHIASIVDGHQGLVVRHYDSASMVKVIGRVQVEADVQGGIILEAWTDERNIPRRQTAIKSYAFSFLLQSFLPPQRGLGGTPRSSSPAVRDKGDTTSTNGNEDENIRTQDIEGLLNEAATMLSRWALYCRFISIQCQQALDADSQPETLSLAPLLVKSNLMRRTLEYLITPFNEMCKFYFRRSVERAFELDEPSVSIPIKFKVDVTGGPYITSAVDDVMFVVNQVLQRTLATQQKDVVSNVIPGISYILRTDFIGMIHRKMNYETFPRAAVQGGMPPEDKIQHFLILMNTLDVAIDYIKRIIGRLILEEGPDSAEGPPVQSISSLFSFENDAAFVAQTLKSLQGAFEAKAMEHLNDANRIIIENIIRPQIRPTLLAAFRDIEYVIDDEVLAERARMVEELTGDDTGGNGEEIVRIKFEHTWPQLMTRFKKILTEHNFDRVIASTCNHFSKILEKKILTYNGRINELGAIHLERDVAAVINTIARGGKYGLRDQFLRCTQICMILNMDDDEWEELKHDESDGTSGIDWKLDADERAGARNMIRDRAS
jgi:hypothetical protein